MVKERVCPNGWNDCDVCLYKQPCHLGLYEPQIEAERENRQAVIEAAVTAEKTVHRETLESVKRISQGSGPKEFWLRWARTSPPDPQNTQREPITAMSGPTSHGGGSKSRKKRKPLRRLADYLKTWGT